MCLFLADILNNNVQCLTAVLSSPEGVDSTKITCIARNYGFKSTPLHSI